MFLRIFEAIPGKFNLLYIYLINRFLYLLRCEVVRLSHIIILMVSEWAQVQVPNCNVIIFFQF